jgi:hypothetical protein
MIKDTDGLCAACFDKDTSGNAIQETVQFEAVGNWHMILAAVLMETGAMDRYCRGRLELPAAGNF